jgi:hypothetical protein
MAEIHEGDMDEAARVAMEVRALREAIERVKEAHAAEVAVLKKLCEKAAETLDIMTQFLLVSDVPLEWEENKRRENKVLIAELRKAAE